LGFKVRKAKLTAEKSEENYVIGKGLRFL
jgi:hypothetical protein